VGESAFDKFVTAEATLKGAERAAGIENLLIDLMQAIPSGNENFVEYRRIVFAVPDLDLRRRVISANRESDRRRLASAMHDLWESQRELDKLFWRTSRNTLASLIFLSVVVMVLAERLFGTTGALIAGVVSLLFGFDRILQAKRDANDASSALRDGIREQTDTVEFLRSHTSFSEMEEKTGLQSK
jgi:hypothetical protein